MGLCLYIQNSENLVLNSIMFIDSCIFEFFWLWRLRFALNHFIATSCHFRSSGFEKKRKKTLFVAKENGPVHLYCISSEQFWLLTDMPYNDSTTSIQSLEYYVHTFFLLWRSTKPCNHDITMYFHDTLLASLTYKNRLWLTII